MANELIIKKAVPVVLKGLGVSAKEIKEIAPALCNALTLYGCRNQEAVVSALKITAPHFAEISDKFLSRMDSIISKGIDVEPQYYDRLIEMAMSDPNLAGEDKITSVADETRKERNNRTNNAIKLYIAISVPVILILSIVCFVLISPKVFRYKDNKGKRDYKAQKLKYRYTNK